MLDKLKGSKNKSRRGLEHALQILKQDTHKMRSLHRKSSHRKGERNSLVNWPIILSLKVVNMTEWTNNWNQQKVPKNINNSKLLCLRTKSRAVHLIHFSTTKSSTNQKTIENIENYGFDNSYLNPNPSEAH